MSYSVDLAKIGLAVNNDDNSHLQELWVPFPNPGAFGNQLENKIEIAISDLFGFSTDKSLGECTIIYKLATTVNKGIIIAIPKLSESKWNKFSILKEGGKSYIHTIIEVVGSEYECIILPQSIEIYNKDDTEKDPMLNMVFLLSYITNALVDINIIPSHIGGTSVIFAAAAVANQIASDRKEAASNIYDLIPYVFREDELTLYNNSRANLSEEEIKNIKNSITNLMLEMHVDYGKLGDINFLIGALLGNN